MRVTSCQRRPASSARSPISSSCVFQAWPALAHLRVRLTCNFYRLDEKRELSNISEEHTSELQSLRHLVCRLLLEKKHVAWVAQVLKRMQTVDQKSTRLTSSP